MSRSDPARALAQLVVRAFDDLGAEDAVLVAVSGGPDSMALLHLLAETLPARGVRLEVAHLDHGLRADSVDDCRFVERVSLALELPFHGRRVAVDALARERGRGVEEAARTARYQFLNEVAVAIGAPAIAIGHTADDRAETLLLNLLRGAGAGGLGGMHATPVATRIRRPLLAARRDDLVRYLELRGIETRLDPSNRDTNLRRNFIRLEILPLLEQVNPRAVEALARAASLLAADDDYLQAVAAAHRPEVDTIAGLPDPVARRLVLATLRARCGPEAPLGHRHIDAVLDAARGIGSARATDLPGGLRAVVRDGRLTIEPAMRPSAPPPCEHPLPVPGAAAVPERRVVARAALATLDDPLVGSGDRVHVAAADPGEALTVRSIRARDRFRALGAPGHRPLGRYLRDRGVAEAERESALVIERNGVILWVVGHQVAEAARVGAGEPALVLECTSGLDAEANDH